MSDEILVRHCAPTLAGLKTASLFTCPFGRREELVERVRELNRRFQAKGLRVLPLRFTENRALIYLFRPGRLRADLADTGAAELLRREGYDVADWGRCLCQLARRLRSRKEFPHEIGLFLGYPAEDVCGFMGSGAGECKCAGCWKVYGDPEAAQRKFEQYKKCTRVYCDRWAKGADIDRLTVAG